MRYILLVLLTIMFTSLHAQTDTLRPANTDSLLKEMQRRTDSMIYSRDSTEIKMDAERNQRSLEQFMAMQEERKEKEKKRAILRIVIGAVLFAVLVVGLLRRRKKTPNT